MAKAGRTPQGTPYSVKTILGYLTSWKTILFTLIFSKHRRRSTRFHLADLTSNTTIHLSAPAVICLLAQGTQQKGTEACLHHRTNCMSFYLVHGFPTTWQTNRAQNEYPTIGNAFTAAYSLLAVWVSDGPLKGRRYPPILFANLCAIVIFTLLVVTPVFGPFHHRAPLYIVSSIGGSAVPLTMA